MHEQHDEGWSAMWAHRNVRVISVCAVGWLALYALLTVVAHASGSSSAWLSDGLYLLPIAAGAVLAFAAARRVSGRRRVFWALVGVYLLLTLCGELVYAYYDTVLHAALPTPSLADAFYLATYAAIFPAVFSGFGAFRELGRDDRLSAMFDGIVLGVTFGILGWHPLVSAHLGRGVSMWALSQMAYPVLDVVLVGMIGSLAAAMRRRVPLSVILIGIAFAFALLGDTLYSYQTLHTDFAPGTWLDLTWQAQFALLCVAAVVAMHIREFRPATGAHRRHDLSPWIVALATLFAAVIIIQQFTKGDAWSAVGGVMVGWLACRLQLSVRELRRSTTHLESARDEAVSASAVKSSFVATVSHELRTPMHGILGLAEELAATKLDDEQRHLLETIRGSADALRVLLDDVLDLSRIDAGRLTISQEPLDVRVMVDDLVALMAPRANQKGFALTVSVDPYLPQWVLGDDVRIRQVLVNLAGNAVKFTDIGEVRISAMRDSTLGEDTVRFEVQDTGIGISGETIASLFQPFSQASTSTTRRYGGTGLGLAISARLVELMGGEISVSSEVGRGSLFTVWLPLPASEPPEETNADAAAANDANTTGIAASPLVLVAEDNLVNQLLVRRLLARFGCDVECAGDGAGAVAAYEAQREKPFDLVLMDCEMPVMDGFEATRRIRAKEPPGSPRLPIVALTANALTGYADLCIEAGMDDVLAKPFDRNAMRHLLEHWLPAGTPPEVTESEDDAKPVLATIDQDTIAQLVEDLGDRESLRPIIDVFLEQLPDRIAAIQAAVDALDRDGARKAAHVLRSPSAALGASDLAERCRVLEDAARAGSLDEAVEQFSDIRQAARLVANALRDL